jgi:NDP-sugar pyrophosphorylase family protein
MIEYVLALLAKHGVNEAVINIHYLPEKMRSFVSDWNAANRLPRLEIQDETKMILGSGGAVALAASWLFAAGESALVCNADVLAEPDLTALLAFQKHHGGVALAVMPHEGAGMKYTGLRLKDGRITGFEKPGTYDPTLFHFPGFYALDRTAAALLPPAGTECSVVEAMWKPLITQQKLFGWQYEGEFLDLGTVADLEAAERWIRAKAR